MPKNQDSLNTDLFELLQSRGYSPTMLDTSGKEVPVADEAEVFQFNFVKDEVDYGTVTVSIDGLHKLVIYFDDKVANSPKERSDSGEQNWYSVLKQLKDFARKHQLSFEIRNTDKLRYDMKKREHLKQLDESYHAINKHKSYSDNIPETKIVIQHSKVMEEGEQRFRHVDKIFIENALGERILAPTNKPGIAQVYARHLAEGGKPHDIRWQHIGAMVEEYSKMAGFVRATRGNQFNESAQRLVNEGLSHYQKLRESLSKMRGKRGYNNYFESWTPPLMEDEEQVDLSEMFMQSSLDPRIESVMPILSKLSKNLGEAKDMAEVIALENWADEIITHKGGKVTRDGNVTRHVAGPDVYGGTVPDEDEDDTLKKSFVNKAEKELGIKWNREKKRAGGIDLGEVKDEEADYGDEYQSDVMKLKQKAHAQEKKKPVDITDLARRLHAVMKKDDEQVEEDLDSNQKRAGQLGPTGGPAKVGDLVGANESVENDEEQVNEMDSEGYKGTRDDYELGKGKEHTGKPVTAKKAKKDFAKILQKSINKSNKSKQDTDKKVAKHADYSKHEKKLISKMSPEEKVDKGWRNPDMKEGWKGTLAGSAAGGVAGDIVGQEVGPTVGATIGGALGGAPGAIAGGTAGAMAGGPIGSAIGGLAGGKIGDTLGDQVKEEQLNEFAPLIAAGARALIPLIARVGPALGRMAGTAGKATADVAGKAATGVGRGSLELGKSAAQSAAQNAGKIGLGVGAYSAITDIADSLVGGVGQVYHDVGSAAADIAKKIGGSVDEATLGQLATLAVKYAIPIGILLAVLYGGKKLIDKVMSESISEGQEDLDRIIRLAGK